MASLKGQCSVACKGDTRSCWHMDCKITKRFTSGKFLIENRRGFIRAAAPAENNHKHLKKPWILSSLRCEN